MNAPPIAEYPKATSPDEPKEERELLWSVFQEGTCELAILVQLGAGSLKVSPFQCTNVIRIGFRPLY